MIKKSLGWHPGNYVKIIPTLAVIWPSLERHWIMSSQRYHDVFQWHSQLDQIRVHVEMIWTSSLGHPMDGFVVTSNNCFLQPVLVMKKTLRWRTGIKIISIMGRPSTERHRRTSLWPIWGWFGHHKWCPIYCLWCGLVLTVADTDVILCSIIPHINHVSKEEQYIVKACIMVAH